MDFHETWYVHWLWGSNLGLLMGKFRQFLTELSAYDISVLFLFLFCFWNLVCASVLWGSDLWLLRANFVHFWQKYLPGRCLYFSFWMIISVNIIGCSRNLVLILMAHLDEHLTVIRALQVRPPLGKQHSFMNICSWKHSFMDICSWNIFWGHSLPSTDSRRAVVSFWQKNVYNTG